MNTLIADMAWLSRLHNQTALVFKFSNQKYTYIRRSFLVYIARLCCAIDLAYEPNRNMLLDSSCFAQ